MLQECVHSWCIDSEGKGKCKKCGAIKDFRALLARERNAQVWGLECFYISTEGVKLAGVKLKRVKDPGVILGQKGGSKLNDLP